MSKTKATKRLTCPASIRDMASEEKPILKCNFFIDLVKTEEMEAIYLLLLHLRQMHNFYWKRHAKKLVKRFSKKVAMRK